MDVDTAHTRPTIRQHPYRSGLRIVDPIEDTQFSLYTPAGVDPRPCDTDRFYFPATAAATVETGELETPVPVPVWIRDEDGTVVAEVTDQRTETVPRGRYTLELSTTRVKVQLAVEGNLTVAQRDEATRIAVDGTAPFHVGARSFHERPAATVTTTEDPGDVMAAVSTFGSALKTTSPERSFPSLRGHPPLVEPGPELSIPDRLASPDTGVEIELPRSLEYVYPAAPLAYYLGATVTPGPRPRIVTDDWEHPLTGTREYGSTVERTLKQVFLLDCVTRTEGYYDVDLKERRAVERAVDLDFGALYDAPLAARLESYLEVPYEPVADAVPTWKLTADVRPDAAYVSSLPFLSNELAVVRCPSPAIASSGNLVDRTDRVDSFYREDADVLTRGGTRAERSSTSAERDATVVRPPDADSIEQTYVGDGIPVGASKMTIDAYYRRLDFEPASDPRIDVTVVCNDDEMSDENVVSEIYGTQDWIDFDIDVEEHLTPDELEALLGEDVDFLHYIGHVDDQGIKCADGYLDAERLEEVNVSAFFLNACSSYEQGRALVEHGAMAGIATKTDIINTAATSVGRTVAKLLNEGFSLAATVSIIEDHEQIGHHYLAIGDGSAYIVENESGTPHKVTAEATGDGRYDVSLFGYPNLRNQLGTIFTPHLKGVSQFSLNCGTMWEGTVAAERLSELLNKQELPVEYETSLTWSSELTEL